MAVNVKDIETLWKQYSEEGVKRGIILESLEPNSVIFECNEGPFVPHEEDGILNLDT